jgi:hypothetical protein
MVGRPPKPTQASQLLELMRRIADGDGARARALLKASPNLAKESSTVGATRETSTEFFLTGVMHYVFAGDTALHVAAAGYALDVARALLKAGADPRARNRHGATPLHYAADGGPESDYWNPKAQAQMIQLLIDAGTKVDDGDKRGITPLHRAVRTRCSSAVSVLLENGANPDQKSKAGSAPRKLATLTTGRGGTGSKAAKEQQARIVLLLESHRGSPRGAPPKLRRQKRP